MRIRFVNARLERSFISLRSLQREYGSRRATAIRARVLALGAYPTLSQVPVTPPTRRHLLVGNRAGQYAVDIDRRCHLVFAPDYDPVPQRTDGGIDTDLVTAIVILEVIDYH